MRNMKNVISISVLAILFFALITVAYSKYGMVSSEEATEDEKQLGYYTTNLPFKMPKIQLPVIPDRECSIADYGAVRDSLTMNTEAFAKAISACADAGGGKVVVPSGSWLTGPIVLKNNIDLHLQAGALVIFSTDRDDYPLIKNPLTQVEMISPSVYGFGVSHVSITGSGMLNGNGDAWRTVIKENVWGNRWRDKLDNGGFLSEDEKYWMPIAEPEDLLGGAPSNYRFNSELISFVDSKSIVMDGVILKNSPQYTLNVESSKDVVIRNVQFNNEKYQQNGNGLDIRRSKNVVIYKNIFTAADDAVVLKSAENIVFIDNLIHKGHSGFAIDSESKYGIKNVLIRNSTIIGTDVGFRFKGAPNSKHPIEGIYVDQIMMKDIIHEAILLGSESANNTNGFRNVRFSNIVLNGALQAVQINTPVQNIEFTNIVMAAKNGFAASNVKNMILQNVKIVPENAGPVFALKDSMKVEFDTVHVPVGADPFLLLVGAKTSEIKLIKTDTIVAKQPFQFGKNVENDAVKQ